MAHDTNPATLHVGRLLSFGKQCLADCDPPDLASVEAFTPAQRSSAAAVLESFAAELRGSKKSHTKRTAAKKSG